MNSPPIRPIVIPLGNTRERKQFSTIKRDLAVIRFCLIILVTIACLIVGVAAGSLLAPTAVAVILALVLAPIANALERLGLWPGAAALITAVAIIGVIVIGTVVFAPSLTAMVKRVPTFVTSVEHKLRPLQKQLAVVENASQQIARATNATPTLNTPHAVPVVVPPSSTSNGIVATVATTAPTVIAQILYVTVLTIFLLSSRRYYTAQLILMPRKYVDRIRVARICRDVKQRVSGYLFTLAMINVGLVIATTICFSIAGIANPLLWGLAYGTLNFVPIIGPTSIIVFSAIFGFATADTLWGAVTPPLILLAIDTVEAYFVQPWLLSRRLIVSPIAIFVMAATLVWMWGAPAAITSVPILILLHTVMVHVPSMRPLAMLLATEHVRAGRSLPSR
ncbi:MAG TPA: AI-2E family transporter [Rhizomicrobium sp.]|nr:AI-2E family transporter [Rhizomicrobium sp.]